MNERIKELVGRAEAYAYEHEEHWHDGPDWQELFNKKFAELIIDECLKAIDRTNTHHVHTTFDQGLVTHTINQSKQAVKDHFSDTKTTTP